MSFGIPVRNGLGVGLLASTSLATRRGTSTAFSPTSLFSAGEQGAWYDPSDLTTLFQDSAGTTPVTTPGQSVGLMLDKSQGLVLGPELVTNGDYSGGSTGWTASLVIISGGVASWLASSGTLEQDIVISAGKTYAVTYTVSGYVSGNVTPRFTGGTPVIGVARAANGTFTEYMVAVADASIRFVGGVFTGSIDNVSVKELPGNHATQSNAAQRPTYGIVPAGGRRNLLTFTEQFDNAVWVLGNGGVGLVPTRTLAAGTSPAGVTACRLQLSLNGGTTATDISSFRQSATLAAGAHTFSVWLRSFDGTSSYALQLTDAAGTATNITVTGTWQRFPVTGTAGGGAINFFVRLRGGQSPANSNTADILFSEPQLETGSTATAYQRVGTAFDVTEAGVASRSYVSFDGTDDGMLTGNIVPGIDKAQVFAGVRKLSDAATGVLIESSSVSTTNPGTIGIFAPSGAAANYNWRSQGSVTGISVSATTFTAPITNVVTGIGDIAADTAILRANGVQVASTATDQGTGNYLTYPLYIGRRAGASFPYNGQIFGLIVRFGTNLSAATITQTEAWLGARVAPTVVI